MIARVEQAIARLNADRCSLVMLKADGEVYMAISGGTDLLELRRFLHRRHAGFGVERVGGMVVHDAPRAVDAA